MPYWFFTATKTLLHMQQAPLRGTSTLVSLAAIVSRFMDLGWTAHDRYRLEPG